MGACNWFWFRTLLQLSPEQSEKKWDRWLEVAQINCDSKSLFARRKFPNFSCHINLPLSLLSSFSSFRDDKVCFHFFLWAKEDNFINQTLQSDFLSLQNSMIRVILQCVCVWVWFQHYTSLPAAKALTCVRLTHFARWRDKTNMREHERKKMLCFVVLFSHSMYENLMKLQQIFASAT